MPLVAVEIKELSNTKIPCAIQVASLTLHSEPMYSIHRSHDVATLSIPWRTDGHADGSVEPTWNFLGPKLPIAGTLVIVEDMPDGSFRVVGATEDFYEVKMALD